MLESKRDQRVKTMAMEFLRDSNGGIWLIYVRKLTVLLCEWSEGQQREKRGLRNAGKFTHKCVAKKYCAVDGGEAGDEISGQKFVLLKDILLDEIECKGLAKPQDMENDPLSLEKRTCKV